MLKKNAMRWVKALRSGKYKQGKHALKTKTEDGSVFCCLGVLADICGVSPRSTVVLRRHNLFDLDTPDGGPKKGKVLSNYNDLADANDSGKTFKQIATWIEKNYKLL